MKGLLDETVEILKALKGEGVTEARLHEDGSLAHVVFKDESLGYNIEEIMNNAYEQAEKEILDLLDDEQRLEVAKRRQERDLFGSS